MTWCWQLRARLGPFQPRAAYAGLMSTDILRGPPPEAAGPGQFTEDGQVIYGAPDPVRIHPQVSTAEAEARYSRAFPEYRGASSPGAAAVLGYEPDVIS
jgi:hypothetical protein